MRTLIVSAFVATSLLAAPAFAASDKAQAPAVMTDTQMGNIVAGAAPVTPGGFGRERADYLTGGGVTGWGEIASQRAKDGTHKTLNDAGKASAGALPTPGAPL